MTHNLNSEGLHIGKIAGGLNMNRKIVSKYLRHNGCQPAVLKRTTRPSVKTNKGGVDL